MDNRMGGKDIMEDDIVQVSASFTFSFDWKVSLSMMVEKFFKAIQLLSLFKKMNAYSLLRKLLIFFFFLSVFLLNSFYKIQKQS